MGGKESVFVVSLGCAKNRVDSEHMLGLLKSKGFQLSSVVEEADIAVINTCAFIQDAVEEAIDEILEVVSLKKHGKLGMVIVVGCLVQRYGYKLAREIPEVDGWLGTGEIHRIAELASRRAGEAGRSFYIGRPLYLPDHRVPRIYDEPFYSAYLKIAEGCSHRCSYCMIPAVRGRFRSRKPQSLVAEARQMIRKGAREINLVAQDTTMYGKDLGGSVSLESLLDRLAVLNGIRWVRLLYCHPDGMSERLLDLIDSEEVLCPYLDLPLQHVNENILRDMGRKTGEESPWELIERIRSTKRRISLRTTLMVGFPGETEEVFSELCEFVKRAEFDHLGVFIFSPEKGTRAARLKPTVTRKEAERRADTLMRLQAGISEKNNQRLVGRVAPVLVEGRSAEHDHVVTGRTATMAPEVDGQVLIRRGRGIVGEIVPVLFTKAYPYDLVGEIAR